MYQSKIKISPKSGRSLENFFIVFCEENSSVYCKALKRRVYFSKLPDAILKRKKSATWRMKCFWVALDILKSEKKYISRTSKGYKEYEIIGCDSNGSKVSIHLREEKTSQKDKIVYFISCF